MNNETPLMPEASTDSQRTLSDRAERIAAPLTDSTEREVLDVVCSDLPGFKYAIESRYTREVIRPSHIAELPHAPNFVIGLINVRGEVLVVFNLESLILGTRSESTVQQVIALGQDEREFAIAACDESTDVRELAKAAVLNPDGVLSGRPYVLGVTDDSRVIVDGEALLRDPSLFIDIEHSG